MEQLSEMTIQEYGAQGAHFMVQTKQLILIAFFFVNLRAIRNLHNR
jgi:uncharacterized protein (UPF0303 family)